jgi:hypothetical protein
MEDRETLLMHKQRENTKEMHYNDCCSLRRFRFGTWTISGRLIFAGLGVHISHPRECVFAHIV